MESMSYWDEFDGDYLYEDWGNCEWEEPSLNKPAYSHGPMEYTEDHLENFENGHFQGEQLKPEIVYDTNLFTWHSRGVVDVNLWGCKAELRQLLQGTLGVNTADIDRNLAPVKDLDHCEICGEIYESKLVKNHLAGKRQTAEHQQLVGEKIFCAKRESWACNWIP